MHILFLSDNFPPETNAPASRLFEHASHWVRLGHQVTVITCVPNFPEGKVFPGYRNRWYVKEEMSGIRVVRVKTYINVKAIIIPVGEPVWQVAVSGSMQRASSHE